MIYLESNNKVPMWDFGSTALHGCLNTGKSYKLCEEWSMPKHDATCLVGSVEWCKQWLTENGFKVPNAIDILLFKDFIEDAKVISVEEFLDRNQEWPIFVKPYTEIKLFTGTVFRDKGEAQWILQHFNNIQLLTRPVWHNIQSEWRVYVNRKKVIGCCCYSGNSLIFPNSEVINDVLDFALSKLDNVSFTLDFAVIDIKRNQLPVNVAKMVDSSELWLGKSIPEDKLWNKTVLIEPNDGWAIGNYGLQPEDYLRFCEDRWKQIINKR